MRSSIIFLHTLAVLTGRNFVRWLSTLDYLRSQYASDRMSNRHRVKRAQDTPVSCTDGIVESKRFAFHDSIDAAYYAYGTHTPHGRRNGGQFEMERALGVTAQLSYLSDFGHYLVRVSRRSRLHAPRKSQRSRFHLLLVDDVAAKQKSKILADVEKRAWAALRRENVRKSESRPPRRLKPRSSSQTETDAERRHLTRRWPKLSGRAATDVTDGAVAHQPHRRGRSSRSLRGRRVSRAALDGAAVPLPTLTTSESHGLAATIEKTYARPRGS
ncbi:hypothetical protein V9T40_007912 [Parthenolecanium corni]|uniref:Uncharacterized protein n=1 Tax=Parthenolecanium corni TaxID=536013 RepID=A0AAN9TQK4_9HEMI